MGLMQLNGEPFIEIERYIVLANSRVNNEIILARMYIRIFFSLAE